MKSKLKNTIPDLLFDNQGSFFERVFEVARKVPYGRVTSYGAIARFLGSTGSARMVGWAMNQSHSCKVPVPAHRVVNRVGLLSGKHHFGDENAMLERLKNEGIEIEDDRVVNFQKYFWDPCAELI